MLFAIPEINKILGDYALPIPTNILGIFLLSDLFLLYEDGYIFGGATPTFIDPFPANKYYAMDLVNSIPVSPEVF